MKIYRVLELETLADFVILIEFNKIGLALWFSQEDGELGDIKQYPKTMNTNNINKTEITDFSDYKNETVRNILIEVLNYASNSTT